MEKKRIAVLIGGPGAGFHASMKSGDEVLQSLPKDVYDPFAVFIDREGRWDIPPEEIKYSADCAFVALHGPYGEDGTVQRILESEGIPYTSSHALSSALGMNKFLTLQTIADHNVRIPNTLFVPRSEWGSEQAIVLKTAKERIGFPAVVKPNRSGLALNVFFVENEKELRDSLAHVFSSTNEALVQEYVSGREFICGVLDRGWSESAFALLPAEIFSRQGELVDYKARHEERGIMQVVPPKNLPPARLKALQSTALETHIRMGASGISQTDMIMDHMGKIFVIEVNTVPQFHPESPFIISAKESGISSPDLFRGMVEAGIYAHAEKKKRRH